MIRWVFGNSNYPVPTELKMSTKKTNAVIALLVTSVLVLLFFFLLSAERGCAPLWNKKSPKKKSVRKTTVSEKKKIPLELVKEIMSQQRESSYNLRQLAEGGIKRITVNDVNKRSEVEVNLAITAKYVDDSTLDGAATFWHRDGDWYLVEVTREPRLYDPPLGTQAAELAESDIEIGNRIVAQQQINQDITTDFVKGKIKSLAVNQVQREIDSMGRDKSIADITTAYADGKTVDVMAELLNHEGFWYLVKISRK